MTKLKSKNTSPTSASSVLKENSATSSISTNATNDKDALQDVESGKSQSADDSEQPIKGKKLASVLVALAVSMFLGALDNTIVSTMMPKISERFSAAMLVTWIFSAYVVSSTALQSVFGKMCHIFGHQRVLLAAHIFFIVGSVVCGASKSAHMLIAGRVIAGVGSSGITAACYVFIGDFIPTAKSPMYIGIFSMVWAFASVAGPLLGGVFADKAGFEWGFYINPIIQGPVILIILVFMRLPLPHGSTIEKLKRIDFIGILTIVSGIVLLELGLTWGGKDYAWNSAAVVTTLVLGIAILFMFVAVEWKLPAEPIMPLRLFKHRNAAIMYVVQITFGVIILLPVFYIPIYLTVVKNTTAVKSGIYLIPNMVATSLSSIISGIFITKTRALKPFLWAGVVINTTGIGLFALFGEDFSNAIVISVPIVFGIGVGISIQAMLCCAQNSVEQEDVGSATTLFMTIRSLGNAVGLAIAQSVLQNQISPRLETIAAKYPQYKDIVDGFSADRAIIWKEGVPEDLRREIIVAFSKSFHTMFYVFLAFGGVSVILTLFVKRTALRKKIGGRVEE
ncbi:hypothetical protein LPJ57_002534 [Coemansia sp. RSA 486]|nr:hypothetical protein LPJ57_002534 [Coemansia sp. RSA 486]KAJ2236234.1 hypothetical protein IWW45_001959 [Coemansia sp. RSA 485]